MKQILISGHKRETYDVPIPTPGNNEILVAVHASVISTGTETGGGSKGKKPLFEKVLEKKEIMEKISKYFHDNGLNATLSAIKSKLKSDEQDTLLRPAGYSNAGIIVAKGHLVSSFNVGDRVACGGAGLASHAEYVTIPVNLAVKIPDQVNFESAAFTTIGAIAMQGIRRANVTFGETVLITGLGLLGLIAVQIAKAWGLMVIGTDVNSKRIELAKELGADFCFNSSDADFNENISRVTMGNGPDAVIIYAATTSSEPANQALKVSRRRGRVVIVGAVGMNLEREAMYLKELDLVMSTSYGPGRYDKQYELKGIDYPIGYVRWTENRNMMEFVRLLAIGKIKIDKLVSNTFTIEQVSDAYDCLTETNSENIASVFKYSHDENRSSETLVEIKPGTVKSGKICAGIIGAGGFVKRNHLANMLSMPNIFEVKGIAQRTPASAKMVGEKYKVNYVTTDYTKLLNDSDIDLIVIGTRHNLHAGQFVDSIKAGKHVLVEKPLALNHDELNMIEEIYRQNPGLIAAVGFNRRYSPFTQMVRNEIRNQGVPVVINYRVNAGYVPNTSWVQDFEEGGGRIIGEVCHFIDLITYLISHEISSMNVIHVPIDNVTILAEDNLIVSIAFNDGSIGVLTYTSFGGKNMEKERIEVMTAGSSLVITDFTGLRTYNSKLSDISLKEADKGHKNMIDELAKKLMNKESLLVPFEQDIDSSRLTLKIIDQIHSMI